MKLKSVIRRTYYDAVTARCVTGFLVGGITANTNMLKEEPIWSMLSKAGVTVGMANVPATFPVMPVNGYMLSGMLTRGKNCEDGVLCAPKLSEVQGGDPIYPASMKSELLSLSELYSRKPVLTRSASRTKNAREWTKKWRKLTLTNSARPAIKTPDDTFT